MYTKEQLESKSDLEINEIVAIKCNEYDEVPNYGEPVTIGDKHCYYDDLRNIFECHADYCNNWADMGPLIDKHDIAVWSFKNHEDELFYSAKAFKAGTRMYFHHVTEVSRLRAAAIVYILMQGGE